VGRCLGDMAFDDRMQVLWENGGYGLMVERTYGAMTNDVLISIPLFVLMGYVMERGALVDKMFYSIQLAFRNVPASLAVATLIVCTFWGIASGLVGAVVVLMGVIAFNPMLKAGYDVKLASGVITAGGTLGILIPPSVMIIVDAEGRPVSYGMLLSNLGYALVPFVIVAGTLWTVWWYVVIHQQAAVETVVTGVQQLGIPGLSTAAATPAEQGPTFEFYLWFWGI